jgi:hypothetical protein
MSRRAAVAILLLALLAALACNRAGLLGSPTPVSLPVPEQGGAGSTAASSDGLTVSLTYGLANLERYRWSLQVAFGSDHTLTIVSDERRSPAGRYATIQMREPGRPRLEEAAVTERDGLVYFSWLDGGCTVQSGSMADPLVNPFSTLLDANWLIGDMAVTAYVGQADRPSGAVAQEYQFAATGLTGSVFVDQRSGLVLGVTAVGQGTFTQFGPAQATTFRLQYELELDQVEELALPPGCPDLRADQPYPLLADATAIYYVDRVLMFESNQELADALAFYQATMPMAGWRAIEADNVLQPAAVLLSYQREAERVVVSLIATGGGRGVSVIIGP